MSKGFRRQREQAQPFVDRLTEQMPADVEWHIGGSWRREAPTVGDLDVMVVTPDGRLDGLILPRLSNVRRQGAKVVSGELIVATEGSMSVDFWGCKPNERGAFLMFITGPKELNVAQRTRAIELGYSLSQTGLLNGDGNQVDDGTEADIYRLLGQRYLHPTEREVFSGPQGATITKKVIGRSGVYTLTIQGRKIACTCPGYAHRQTCRHVTEELEARGVLV